MVIRNNPLIKNQGICDPHIFIFDGKAYLYASHDISIENTSWYMENWHIYSSEDLVNWKLEDVIYPEDTFVGKSNQCWAVECVKRNDKYYFYFCIANKFIGVLVSDRPNGGFKDVLGKPLIDGSTSKLEHEYDPTVFVDDDDQAYIVYGLNEGEGYAMAKLNKDMISLDGRSWIVPVIGTKYNDDKPFLFKKNGWYYLTFGPTVCISDNVKGPYKYICSNGTGSDHGSYFTYKGQDFYAHGYSNRSGFYRDSALCYAHYLEDNTIITDQMVIEFGVGAYDANSYQIPMTWFMEGKNTGKSLNWWNRLMLDCKCDCVVKYPNVYNMKDNPMLYLFGVNGSGVDVIVDVYLDDVNGKKIGQILWETEPDWNSYRYKWMSTKLDCVGETQNLVFAIRPAKDDIDINNLDNILKLEWMHLE